LAPEENTDSEELAWPDRHAGILLHPTSLPGRFGIGDLGPEAHRFLDLLKQAGQSLWQIMPLGPAGPGDSPYAARSSFAGNPLLISMERLVEDGLLESHRLAHPPAFPGDRIDFPAVARWKEPLFREAFARFDPRNADGVERFREESRSWLPDYALYMALSSQLETSWREWPGGLARRDPGALADARSRLSEEIAYREFLQWQFYRQWQAVKLHANTSAIRIVGDIPIFVAYDSSDVWANQHIFKLGDDLLPEVIAGVPPDAFSATGQRWGNPLYRWDVLKAEGYGWWLERLRQTFTLVDLVRIDHFRGFEAAWEIPAHAPTAETGTWVPGPGSDFFDRAEAELGHLGIIVEDLGLITRKVRELRDDLGYPGMKVLQFAFGDDARNPYLPHNIPVSSVVYTGTHDNDTTLGWFRTRPAHERDRILRYLAVDGSDIVSDLIRVAYSTVSEMAIVPMQDVLRLGSEARTNTPGEPEGNWGWRFQWSQVDMGRIAWLRDIATLYGRRKP
jgi:4-alpha-glucanotransferase